MLLSALFFLYFSGIDSEHGDIHGTFFSSRKIGAIYGLQFIEGLVVLSCILLAYIPPFIMFKYIELSLYLIDRNNFIALKNPFFCIANSGLIPLAIGGIFLVLLFRGVLSLFLNMGESTCKLLSWKLVLHL